MSPDAQRIAIAQECGWRIYESNGGTYYEIPNAKPHLRNWHTGYDISFLPDYLNDLNTMHEVEKKLFTKRHTAMRYEEQLVTVCQWTHPPGTEMGSLWHATAAQRAEAFLRTIGKWEN